MTASRSRHLVSQAFCSALPLSYSNARSLEWESLARLIIEAAHESTLLAAVENARRTPGAPVYLTQLGGGAFGNRTGWIVGAMERAFHLLADSGLDVRIVHYSGVRDRFRGLERG